MHRIDDTVVLLGLELDESIGRRVWYGLGEGGDQLHEQLILEEFLCLLGRDL